MEDNSTIIAAVIGAVSGGFFGAFTPLFLSGIEERRARKSIKGALAAEIESISLATEQAGLLESVSALRERAESGEDVYVPNFLNKDMNLDPIFAALLHDLGRIEPQVSSEVANFYRRVRLGRYRLISFQNRAISDIERAEFIRSMHIVEGVIKFISESEKLVAKLR